MRDAEFKDLPIEALQRCQYQVRRNFADDALEELAASIKAQGIIEPIVVRKIDQNDFEIIAGERRWRAAQRAGLFEVPCVIRDVRDNDVREMVLIENLHREELNPIEEAHALLQLVELNGLSHEELAKRLGKTRLYITQRLRLLQLGDALQQLVISGELSAGHTVALITLPETDQNALAAKAIHQRWSVRRLEKVVRERREGKTVQSVTTITDADTAALIARISEYFGAKTSLEYKPGKKGRLSLDFYSLDELDGILAKAGMSV